MVEKALCVSYAVCDVDTFCRCYCNEHHQRDFFVCISLLRFTLPRARSLILFHILLLPDVCLTKVNLAGFKFRVPIYLNTISV